MCDMIGVTKLASCTFSLYKALWLAHNREESAAQSSLVAVLASALTAQQYTNALIAHCTAREGHEQLHHPALRAAAISARAKAAPRALQLDSDDADLVWQHVALMPDTIETIDITMPTDSIAAGARFSRVMEALSQTNCITRGIRVDCQGCALDVAHKLVSMGPGLEASRALTHLSFSRACASDATFIWLRAMVRTSHIVHLRLHRCTIVAAAFTHMGLCFGSFQMLQCLDLSHTWLSADMEYDTWIEPASATPFVEVLRSLLDLQHLRSLYLPFIQYARLWASSDEEGMEEVLQGTNTLHAAAPGFFEALAALTQLTTLCAQHMLHINDDWARFGTVLATLPALVATSVQGARISNSAAVALCSANAARSMRDAAPLKLMNECDAVDCDLDCDALWSAAELGVLLRYPEGFAGLRKLHGHALPLVQGHEQLLQAMQTFTDLRDLAWEDVSRDQVAGIARAMHMAASGLQGLGSLRIQGNEYDSSYISADVLRMCSALHTLPALASLHFECLTLGDAGVSEIGRTALPALANRLTYLNLRRTGFGNKGAMQLAQALKSMHTLKSVTVRGNEFCERAALVIVGACTRLAMLTHLVVV